MPRRYLTFQSGCYYHLYNRGNDRDRIFFERENYLYFLRLVRQHLIEQTLDVLAYCLMPNHYHLLVQCKTEDVSGAMMRLSVAYTKAMNRRYQRVGSLFQGQFQAIVVDSDAYLYNLTQYIHLNPVKAGIVLILRIGSFPVISNMPDFDRALYPKSMFCNSNLRLRQSIRRFWSLMVVIHLQ